MNMYGIKDTLLVYPYLEQTHGHADRPKHNDEDGQALHTQKDKAACLEHPTSSQTRALVRLQE